MCELDAVAEIAHIRQKCLFHESAIVIVERGADGDEIRLPNMPPELPIDDTVARRSFEHVAWFAVDNLLSDQPVAQIIEVRSAGEVRISDVRAEKAIVLLFA